MSTTGGGLKLADIVEIIDGEVLYGADSLENRVEYGFAADMMSDVLAMIKPGSVLLTGLIHAQAIRTAEIAECSVVVFARGKRPRQDVIDLAEEIGMPVIATRMILFEACGKLFEKGLKP